MTEAAAAAAAALYVNDIDRKKRQDRECNNPAHYITPRRPIKPTAHNCGSLSTTYELVCIRPAGDRPTDGLATRYLCTLYRSLFGTDDKKTPAKRSFRGTPENRRWPHETTGAGPDLSVWRVTGQDHY